MSGRAGFGLACLRCETDGPGRPGAGVCPGCAGPLLVRYPLDALDGGEVLRKWARRPPGMWRFREVLPLRAGEEPVSLGEGGTPLLPAPRIGGELGLRLYVKDEGRNPTGSFKDRGLSAAVTRAAREGARAVVLPSAGNAAVSAAAYAARAGLAARVYVPADTPRPVLRRLRPHGAEVIRVDGLIDECGTRAAEWARESGARPLSTLREPYRVEGKKTMMLEIVEALGRPPDALVYPTGGGTGLIGSWKALRELHALGATDSAFPTRMYAVQAEGCAPIVRAWAEGGERAAPWTDARTTAWGLRVPSAVGDFLMLRALRESGGGAVAVPDGRMEREASALAAGEGIAAGIEGGATLAAARRLREEGHLREGETVVLFNTGHLTNY